MDEIKNLNVKIPKKSLEELKYIQSYYSLKLGVSFTQKETLIRLLSETANLIKNIGETYPGRNWDNEKYGRD